MWVVFLAAFLAFVVVGMIVVYFGNKIFNSMNKDNAKTKMELERIEKKEE